MTGLFRSFHSESLPLQATFSVAVVVPTILRPTLAAAMRSVFSQRTPLRIQILVGIDVRGDEAPPDIEILEKVCQHLPGNCLLQVFYPGYSTSQRHGGLAAAYDGGALRTVLTHLANAPYVAYLDDDNCWEPDHLTALGVAIETTDADYAYTRRWYAHHETLRPVAIDEWESVGPYQGIWAERGGFVDPNTLMIDRERCREAIVAWTTPLPGDPSGMSADRMVFDRLLRHKGVGVLEPTVFYRLNPSDIMHPFRMDKIGHLYGLCE